MILTLGRPWQHPARCWTGSQRKKVELLPSWNAGGMNLGPNWSILLLNFAKPEDGWSSSGPKPRGGSQIVPERNRHHQPSGYKAIQLQKRGVIRVTDLMCGIGGDTAAFHRAGLEAHAIDHDPFRVRCAAHNAGCAFTEQDIRNRVDDGSFVHLDPPRRDASGKRRHQWQDLLPDPAVLRELQTSVAQGVYKLSPGTDPDEPDLESCHLEWLSEKGRLTQCLAWWGEPPSDERSVVRLDDGWMFRGVPTPDLTHRGHFGAYLIRADPLLERSGLQWTYARSCSSLESVCPGLGLLTADTLPTETGLEVWEVEEVLPWREKKLKAAIRSRDGGEVVVHTRGRAVDPDQAAASLRGDGPNKIHLWCVRVGTPRLGIIVKRPT